MNIVLNIESEEYLYEANILVNAFLAQVKAEKKSEELFDQESLNITIEGKKLKFPAEIIEALAVRHLRKRRISKQN